MRAGDILNNDLASTIRSKVDIVDIIGERIPLTARRNALFLSFNSINIVRTFV